MTEKIMNSMKKYSKVNFLVVLLAVVSLLVILPAPEAAAMTISVDAKSLNNTIIIEFTQETTDGTEIQKINVWVSKDNSFTSFKTESGWAGATYGDGQGILFTASLGNELKSGESIKFAFKTDKKATGINWKATALTGFEVGKGKVAPNEVSQDLPNITTPQTPGSEPQVTQISDDRIKFIPEKIRIASNERLIGNEFNPNETLQLFLNDTLLESIRTDENGNFITKLKIPTTAKIGINDFQIKRQDGVYENTKLKIYDSLNRFYDSEHRFGIVTFPETVKLEDKLTISGTAQEHSGVILAFNDGSILEKKHVVIADSDGKWSYDQTVSSDTLTGLKSIVIENNQKSVLKNITITADFAFQLTTSSDQYNTGDAVTITGNTEANQKLALSIINPNSNTILFDNIQSDGDGKFEYEFSVTSTFASGTYAAIAKTMDNKSQATIFGINSAPTEKIIILLDKLNFQTTADLVLRVVGPVSSTLTVEVLDSSDKLKVTNSIHTNSAGNGQFTLDLNGYKSGVYRAVVSHASIEDIAKFSVGLQTGTGDITISPTKSSYSPGEEIRIIGQTENSNSILFVSLVSPNGDKVSEIEIFSDKSGQFSTNLLRIPSDAPIGVWTLEANSRLDSASATIDVEI